MQVELSLFQWSFDGFEADIKYEMGLKSPCGLNRSEWTDRMPVSVVDRMLNAEMDGRGGRRGDVCLLNTEERRRRKKGE